MEKNEPRYRPTYAPEGINDKFLGYANDLDVWHDTNSLEVYIVGPDEKRARPESSCNFDAFDIDGGSLTNRQGIQDLYIDVHDMCLIYALCVEHGVFKGD